MREAERPRLPGLRRSRWWLPSRKEERGTPALVLNETLAALGRSSTCVPSGGERRRFAETVSLARVAGTVARAGDFDRELRPAHEGLRDRWERIAALADTTAALPPVSLVRVGELYFVEDGHHRISVARARGQLAVDAHVRAVCTVAFACACLTQQDLITKAAERDFLATIPLPDAATRDLWLDDPADYGRLAAAARAWIAQHECCVAPATAAAWWEHEVVPLAHTAGCTGPTSTAAAYLFADYQRKTDR